MIKEFTNLSLVDEIVEEAHRRRSDLKVESFKKHLISSMIANDSYIKIDTLDGEVIGFMFATVQEFMGEPISFVQEAFTTEKGKTSLRDLLDDLESWSHSKDLTGIYFVTSRNPKAWTRKYNFDHIAAIMKVATIIKRRI